MTTGATWYCCENPTAATDPTEKQFLRLLWFLKWPEPQWCYQDVAEGGSVEVKQWDVLSEPDVKASRLLSRASSLWKWLRDVWWAEEETPFTTALLSLWEFIIHTDWPHTWAHTHTQSFICMQYPLWETITHMQSEMWTLWGRCVHYSPHYKYDSVGIPCPTHAGRLPCRVPPTRSAAVG